MKKREMAFFMMIKDDCSTIMMGSLDIQGVPLMIMPNTIYN